MKIAVTVCATERYSYALTSQARRVQAACSFIEDPHAVLIILVGKGKTLTETELLYKELMPNAMIFTIIMKSIDDDAKRYKGQAQLIIGQLRTAAFGKARALDVDFCWSLDSDVLPPANSLKCMLNSLEFDDGYYSIATCPYPNRSFIGGRGTPTQQICPDFYEQERKIPEDLKNDQEKLRKEFNDEKDHDKKGAIHKQLEEIAKKVNECPPLGNVFEMNAKEWQLRGWFENAYPGIGKGSIVPIDWCGFGCTLMNRKALSFAHFDGYEGAGTEDLYVIWNRWHPEGLRINAVAHCLCDHVVRNPGDAGKYVVMQPYHETSGKFIGHIRLRDRPFYSFDGGEIWDEKNDGRMHPEKTSSKEALTK